MTAKTTPPTDNIDIAGIALSEQQASLTATGGHLVANLIPGAGIIIDTAATKLDGQVIKLGIMHTWHDHIAAALNIDPKMLSGQQGIDIINDENNLAKLPPVLMAEWQKADEIAERMGEFIGGNTAQYGATAAAATLGFGIIPGLALGLGAQSAVQPLIKSMIGSYDTLSPSMVVSAIHGRAREAVNQHENPRAQTAPPDLALIGTYLITTDPQLSQEYNNADLIAMYQEHLQKKQEDPKAHTDLEMFINRIDREESAFAQFVPEGRDMSRFKTNSFLEIAAQHINSEKDIGDILFKPESFKNKIALSASGALDAGRTLNHNLATPGQKVQLPPKPAAVGRENQSLSTSA